MGPDLKSTGWIVAKGLLFAFLALASAALQVIEDYPIGIEIGLLGICVWASCRFYYFLFHVLHAYVDPDLKSAGLLDLSAKLLKRGTPRIRKYLPHLDTAALRRLQLILVGGCMAFALAGIILPLVGADDILSDPRLARLTLPKFYLVKWMGTALVGPVMLLLCCGTVIHCVLGRKRLPWLIPLLSLVSVYGVRWGARPVSHDLGHALFDSCGGYGDFIGWLTLVGIVSIPSCYFLNLREHGVPFRLSPSISGYFHRFKAVSAVIVSILLIWYLAAYFMDLF